MSIFENGQLIRISFRFSNRVFIFRFYSFMHFLPTVLMPAFYKLSHLCIREKNWTVYNITRSSFSIHEKTGLKKARSMDVTDYSIGWITSHDFPSKQKPKKSGGSSRVSKPATRKGLSRGTLPSRGRRICCSHEANSCCVNIRMSHSSLFKGKKEKIGKEVRLTLKERAGLFTMVCLFEIIISPPLGSFFSNFFLERYANLGSSLGCILT